MSQHEARGTAGPQFQNLTVPKTQPPRQFQRGRDIPVFDPSELSDMVRSRIEELRLTAPPAGSAGCITGYLSRQGVLEHYRTKWSASNGGVNASYSLEEILAYHFTHPVQPTKYAADEVPYESVIDYVNTLRNSATGCHAAFWWPSSKVDFQRSFGTALHMLPPGCFLCLHNKRPPPASLLVQDTVDGTPATKSSKITAMDRLN